MHNFKKTLKEILLNIEIISITGDINIDINGISCFSKDIKENYIFVSINGFNKCGNIYINEAIQFGAKVIILENCNNMTYNPNITYIKVKNSSLAMGFIAHAFYGHLSNKIYIVGITGTNGKTTCAKLLYDLFTSLGLKCGLISTIGNIYNNTFLSTNNTTPNSIEINKLIFDMYLNKCKYIFMEVSSHAIYQNRVAGIKFTGGVFTNITKEHLDYHGSFYNYIKAKKTFFDQLNKNSFALVNSDDKNSDIMLQNTQAKKFKYGINNIKDFYSKIIEINIFGMLISINNIELWVQLTGLYNVYNILSVYSVAIILGFNKIDILKHISLLKRVKGRYEMIIHNKTTFIIDYAHTPDAVCKILLTTRSFLNKNSKIITVIGCGGNKYIDKRYSIGTIVNKLSHISILTSDNPNNEDPIDIIHDMKKNINITDLKKIIEIVDRKQAIIKAFLISKPNDIVLLLGKGHEKYQLINGIKYFFCEYDILIQCIKKYNN